MKRAHIQKPVSHQHEDAPPKEGRFAFAPKLISRALVGLFWLTFWLPSGIKLGGDPYWFGRYVPELSITLPWAGICILVLFFLRLASGSMVFPDREQGVYLWGILAIMGFITLFSFHPQTSILLLIVWGIGFLVWGLQEDFRLSEVWQQHTFLVGIGLGFLAWVSGASFAPPAELIGVAALVLAFFIRQQGRDMSVLLSILFLCAIVLLSGSVSLLFLALIFWGLGPLWVAREERMRLDSLVVVPLLFLIAGGCLVFFLGLFDWSRLVFSPIIVHDWLFGAGQGNFLPAWAAHAGSFVPLEALSLPGWGILVTFTEMGLFGMVLVGLLVAAAGRWRTCDFPALRWLLVGAMILTPVLLHTENGILLLLVLLFGQRRMREGPSGRFEAHLSSPARKLPLRRRGAGGKG